MCSDSEKNMSAFADQNHAPSLTYVRLEFEDTFKTKLGRLLPAAHVFLLITTGLQTTLT